MDSTWKTRKTLIASGLALAFASEGVHAWHTDPIMAPVSDIFGNFSFITDSGNLTWLAPDGGVFGGTNDVAMTWDGDAYGASAAYTGPGGYSNVTLTSTTPFLGIGWVAHDIQMFMPGTYSFDTALGGGNPEAGSLALTVGAGQLGMHMLWDWNGNLNVDMAFVFSLSSQFGAGIARSTMPNCNASYTETVQPNCLWDGGGYGPAGQPAGNTVWLFASTDGNGDGIAGIPMAAGGPLAGVLSANFNFNQAPIEDISDLTSLPIPPAAWLFASGLLGVAGLARRKKRD